MSRPRIPLVLITLSLSGAAGAAGFETSVADARIAIEAVRRSIAETTIPIGNEAVCHITGSFGLAELGVDASDVSTLVSRADEALYRAKEHGRNCTCAGPKREIHVSRVSMRAVAASA